MWAETPTNEENIPKIGHDRDPSDIGKPGVTLGWAIVGNVPEEGKRCRCVRAKACVALRIWPLALVFEPPMFVPIRKDPSWLTTARASATLARAG